MSGEPTDLAARVIGRQLEGIADAVKRLGALAQQANEPQSSVEFGPERQGRDADRREGLPQITGARGCDRSTAVRRIGGCVSHHQPDSRQERGMNGNGARHERQ